MMNGLCAGYYDSVCNNWASLRFMRQKTVTRPFKWSNRIRGIDIVLLDLEMPGPDGFDTLKMIRQSGYDDISQIPVNVVTGHAEQDMVIKAAKIGINGYVIKPTTPHKLKEALDKGMVTNIIAMDTVKQNYRIPKTT